MAPIDREDRSALPRERWCLSSSVLLIDDDPTASLIARHVLERQGYEVVVARDGREGLELALARSFDAIITDMVMPGMDGCAFCERLLAERPGLEAPILVITSAPETWRLEPGRFVFVDKPLSPARLVERLAESLA